jgi:hypothetical protein
LQGALTAVRIAQVVGAPIVEDPRTDVRLMPDAGTSLLADLRRTLFSDYKPDRKSVFMTLAL